VGTLGQVRKVSQEAGKIESSKLNRNMFVSRVVGKSMEPLIPDGSYCIFQANVVGSRNGKVVLVQWNTPIDPETGGKYTVKKYTSKKKYESDDSFQHEEITLSPINPSFKAIIFLAAMRVSLWLLQNL